MVILYCEPQCFCKEWMCATPSKFMKIPLNFSYQLIVVPMHLVQATQSIHYTLLSFSVGLVGPTLSPPSGKLASNHLNIDHSSYWFHKWKGHVIVVNWTMKLVVQKFGNNDYYYEYSNNEHEQMHIRIRSWTNMGDQLILRDTMWSGYVS